MLTAPTELIVADHLNRQLAQWLAEYPKLDRKKWEIEVSCLAGDDAMLALNFERVYGANRERTYHAEVRFQHNEVVSLAWLKDHRELQRCNFPVHDCYYCLKKSVETNRRDLGQALAMLIWHHFVGDPMPDPAGAHDFINSRLA